MHIVHLNLVFEAGTTARALAGRYTTLSTLAERQAAAGAQVTVLQRFDSDDTLQVGRVTYEMQRDAWCRPSGRPWLLATRLARRAATIAPNVVHLHGLDFAVHTRALRLMLPTRTALVVQDHGTKPWARRRMRRARRSLLAAADGFLLNTTEMAQPLQDAGVLPGGVACYGVRESSSTFHAVPQPEARRVTGLGGDPLVLWVGRLASGKDPFTAVEGFCRAARDLPNARLALVFQQATAREAVQALVERHGLADRVTFAGAVAHADLPRYYASADLFLSASHWEGSNYALLESAACGLWPVCSNNPSHRGMLGGIVGHLFERGDAASCAAALKAAAMAAPEARAWRAWQVRAHFDATLSWEAVVRQSFEAYAAAARARQPRWSKVAMDPGEGHS
jgi:glycosyltransferase involved in cell wall biosynthesis